MVRLIMVTEKDGELEEMRRELGHRGYSCMLVAEDEAAARIAEQSPGLVILGLNSLEKTRRSVGWLKEYRPIPVLAMLPVDAIAGVNGNFNADDFIVSPCNVLELLLRIKRLLGKAASESGELIECGDLKIDLAQCEVAVSGRLVELTFREYELLKFLAANRGRVFSREALLDRVWGYDYFGGDRTVDVHIRRLRSKIEDANHSFIDTVRNVGYRFK